MGKIMTKLMQNMTKEELAEVEVDKAKWLEAWKMYKTCGGKRIVNWLEANKGKPEVEDMRRRLNVIRTNNKSK
jgi:hypothetical protein